MDTKIVRRALFAAQASVAAGVSARAQSGSGGDTALAGDPQEKIVLWPATPPGGAGVHLSERVVERSTDLTAFHDRYVDHIGTPHLLVCRPAKPNGAAVLIAPGGGYARIVLDKEGYETARRLADAGITAFVLHYRLPGDGWAQRQDVPLQDVQRAMRLVRANAAHYGIDPARLGVMGFSAGGHVAASLATRFAVSVYPPVDAADAQDARPAFACLMYPVLTMGAGAHSGSRDLLLGANPSSEKIDAYSCEKHLPATMAPVFLALAGDDVVVPPDENGIAMAINLHQAKVPVCLHVFEEGGHGFGLRLAGGHPCAAWPQLFLNWLRSHRFITE